MKLAWGVKTPKALVCGKFGIIHFKIFSLFVIQTLLVTLTLFVIPATHNDIPVILFRVHALFQIPATPFRIYTAHLRVPTLFNIPVPFLISVTLFVIPATLLVIPVILSVIPVILSVIPAKAGIHFLRNHYSE